MHATLWASQKDPPDDAEVSYEAAPTLEQLTTWQLEMLMLYLLPYLHHVRMTTIVFVSHKECLKHHDTMLRA